MRPISIRINNIFKDIYQFAGNNNKNYQTTGNNLSHAYGTRKHCADFKFTFLQIVKAKKIALVRKQRELAEVSLPKCVSN